MSKTDHAKSIKEVQAKWDGVLDDVTVPDAAYLAGFVLTILLEDDKITESAYKQIQKELDETMST